MGNSSNDVWRVTNGSAVHYLTTKWGVSRGRDTYGYNICSLYVDGSKVSSCSGGGYDLTGTVVGLWLAKAYAERLRKKIKAAHYGLCFINPNYDPGKAKIDGETVEEREKAGKSVGLERYQAYYSASSKLPTKQHTVPHLNGGCGIDCMWKVAAAIGLKVERVRV